MTVAYQILWLFYTLGGRGCVVCLLPRSLLLLLLLLLTTLESLSAQDQRTYHSKTRVTYTAISTKHKLLLTYVLDHASENDARLRAYVVPLFPCHSQILSIFLHSCEVNLGSIKSGSGLGTRLCMWLVTWAFHTELLTLVCVMNG